MSVLAWQVLSSPPLPEQLSLQSPGWMLSSKLQASAAQLWLPICYRTHYSAGVASDWSTY